MQGKHSEHDASYKRAIEAEENALGPDHSDMTIRVINRARLYEKMVLKSPDNFSPPPLLRPC